MYSKSIQNIIDSLTKIPSIGPRQATRIAFFLLKTDKTYVENFSKNLIELRENVTLCPDCFLSSENNICRICSDNRRVENIICIVQKEVEINNIENASTFNGKYLVIGEDIDIFKNDTLPLSIQKLFKRLDALKNSSKETPEIILATNPTTEGDAMADYIKSKLQNYNVKITHLGRGLSSGGDLEYTDRNTLFHAFKNRS